MSRKVKILKSAICSPSSVGLIDFLAENFELFGVDIREPNLCQSIDKVKKYYIISSTNLGERLVIEDYLKIINEVKPDWIISGPEEEILILAKNKNIFDKYNVKLFHPSYSTLEIISDKYKSYSFFKEHMNIPDTWLLEETDLSVFNENEYYILKPRFGRGSSNIYKIKGRDIKFLKYTSLVNKNFIIQKYIDGVEYTVDVLCDMNGKILNIVTRERLIVDSGISIIARTVKDHFIPNYIQKLTDLIQFKGMFCVQFIKKFDTYYLTDINPRFGGGSILSLYSVNSLKNNLISLLKGDFDNLVYNNINDYQEHLLLRYYKDIIKCL